MGMSPSFPTLPCDYFSPLLLNREEILLEPCHRYSHTWSSWCANVTRVRSSTEVRQPSVRLRSLIVCFCTRTHTYKCVCVHIYILTTDIELLSGPDEDTDTLADEHG